jgi:hypothetical protein
MLLSSVDGRLMPRLTGALGSLHLYQTHVVIRGFHYLELFASVCDHVTELLTKDYFLLLR